MEREAAINMSVNGIDTVTQEALQKFLKKSDNQSQMLGGKSCENYSNLFFKNILPPFEKELAIQSVFVFQVDGDAKKYVILNRTFKRTPGDDILETYDVELNTLEENMLNPPAMHCAFENMSLTNNNGNEKLSAKEKDNNEKNSAKISNGQTAEPKKLDESESAKASSTTENSSSRRKRKFCKPVKIPQGEDASFERKLDAKKIKLEDTSASANEEMSCNENEEEDTNQDEQPDDLSLGTNTNANEKLGNKNSQLNSSDINSLNNNPMNFTNVLSNAFAQNAANPQLSALFNGMDNKSLIIDANYRAMAPIFTTILSPHVQRPPLYCPLDLSNATNMGQFVTITPNNTNPNTRAAHSPFFNAASLSPLTMPRPIRPRIASVAMVGHNPTSAGSTLTVNSGLNTVNVAGSVSKPPSSSQINSPHLKTANRVPYTHMVPQQSQKNNYKLDTMMTDKHAEEKKSSVYSVNENVDSLLQQARRYAKSFVCNQCKKVFSSLSALCEHTFAVHKAFKCTICNAQFTQRSNLQRHSLRHVGFKPFICNICSKAYYRKDHLVRHIELTHPGANPRTSITVKLSSAECLDYLEKHPPDESEYAARVDMSAIEKASEILKNPMELVMKTISEQEKCIQLATAKKLKEDGDNSQSILNLDQSHYEEGDEFDKEDKPMDDDEIEDDPDDDEDEENPNTLKIECEFSPKEDNLGKESAYLENSEKSCFDEAMDQSSPKTKTDQEEIAEESIAVPNGEMAKELQLQNKTSSHPLSPEGQNIVGDE